jgi:hypothetical protein
MTQIIIAVFGALLLAVGVSMFMDIKEKGLDEMRGVQVIQPAPGITCVRVRTVAISCLKD